MKHAQKHRLRQKIRQQRRALPRTKQHRLAQQLAQKAIRQPTFRRAQRIAVYLPFDGEVDTHAIIQAAWQANKHVFIPIVPKQGRRLAFWHYQPHTHCRTNRYGIREPLTTQRCFLNQLMLIYVPLVAFDDQNYRLGMGGGFYDATLAKLPAWRLPKRIGLAYAFQRHNPVPREAWDQPLHRVLHI